MLLEGIAAVEMLAGPDGMRDSLIRCIQISDEEDLTVVRIKLEGGPGSWFSTIEVTLRNIVEFGFYDSGELGGHAVAFQKCIVVNESEFYLSLDPYDESVSEPVDEDNYVVQARSIQATFTPR